MRILSALLTVLALAATSPAHAEWWQARSDHFVLTIDDSEEGARSFATRLERFDAALRLLYGVQDSADRRARPIAIYAMRQDLFDKTCQCPDTLGYYNPRAEGSLLFTTHMPDTDRKAKTGGWSSQTVLLHEYSHHFTYSNFPIAYPYWFSEGFAEFNANVTFEEDGSVVLGYPANYRAYSLLSETIPPKQLFDPQRYGFGDNLDLLYGRGWLLTHYLVLNPQRKGQLAAYLSAMNRGTLSLDAAKSAFGDLRQLDKELNAYQRGHIAAPLRIPPAKEPLAIRLTRLTPGQTEMLPVHLSILDGLGKGQRLGAAQRAGRIAARFPDDAIVQDQWAEAEIGADRLDKADAAVDRALELQPDMTDALVHKGTIALLRAKEAHATDPAKWSAARGWFLKANRLDPNAVMPLYLFYTSFTAAKAEPSKSAVNALMRAVVLAPEATNVRMALARHQLLAGDAAMARALLQPIAFEPHLARKANVPRQVLELIDAGKIDEAKALLTAKEKDDDSED